VSCMRIRTSLSSEICTLSSRGRCSGRRIPYATKVIRMRIRTSLSRDICTLSSRGRCSGRRISWAARVTMSTGELSLYCSEYHRLQTLHTLQFYKSPILIAFAHDIALFRPVNQNKRAYTGKKGPTFFVLC
jgi:hypothetical protein